MSTGQPASKESTIIAIDGPSASGKSSTSQYVAEVLGYIHVDTGSMYRAFAWKVVQEKINPTDLKKILDLLKTIQYETEVYTTPRGLQRVRPLVDQKDPGNELREPEVEKTASIIASIPEVRSWLVDRQRELVRHGNLVAEGRDIGTVVFPNTPYKFFLDADPQVRAQRRQKDQENLGNKLEVQGVNQALIERDRRDSTRSVAPLKPASDAHKIDTTHHKVEETADLILKEIRTRHAAG
jgi:cytidylate kinase